MHYGSLVSTRVLMDLKLDLRLTSSKKGKTLHAQITG